MSLLISSMAKTKSEHNYGHSVHRPLRLGSVVLSVLISENDVRAKIGLHRHCHYYGHHVLCRQCSSRARDIARTIAVITSLLAARKLHPVP